MSERDFEAVLRVVKEIARACKDESALWQANDIARYICGESEDRHEAIVRAMNPIRFDGRLMW